METVLVEAAKQVPSLVVLVFVVWYFLQFVKDMRGGFMAFLSEHQKTWEAVEKDRSARDLALNVSCHNFQREIADRDEQAQEQGRKYLEEFKADFVAEMKRSREHNHRITDALFASAGETARATTAAAGKLAELVKVVERVETKLGASEHFRIEDQGEGNEK